MAAAPWMTVWARAIGYYGAARFNRKFVLVYVVYVVLNIMCRIVWVRRARAPGGGGGGRTRVHRLTLCAQVWIVGGVFTVIVMAIGVLVEARGRRCAPGARASMLTLLGCS